MTSDAYVYDNTVVFHPTFSFGTAAVRGQKKLTAKTIAYWEVVVPYVYGTSMMFGIGDANAKVCFDHVNFRKPQEDINLRFQMFSPIYFENLLGGSDNHSMGLSHKGFIYHNGSSIQFTIPFKEREPAVVGLLFNGPEKTLSYFLNNEPLGIAFRDIDLKNTLYPMVSSTAQKSQFSVTHQLGNIQSDFENPAPLLEICISKLLNTIDDPRKLSTILPPSIMSNLVEHIILKTNNHHKVFAEEFGFDSTECTQLSGTCVDCGQLVEGESSFWVSR